MLFRSECKAPTPFMLFACRARALAKERVPAVVHVNGSCRLQTLTAEDNGIFHALVEEFGRQTGVPILLNTSFNGRNEPIVCTPEDAYACYRSADLDGLVMGNFFVEKQP